MTREHATQATVRRVEGPRAISEPMNWRAALTPRARASRRRWVVFYVVLLVTAAAATGWGRDLGMGPSPVALVAIFLVFGMLRRGTRQLAAVDRPDLDERDRQELHSAFRYAYPLFMLVMAASCAILALTLPDLQRSGENGLEVGHFLANEVLIGVLGWAFLWAVFLPTAVLAWREPDPAPLDDEEEPREASEWGRDLLLATAMAAAVAVAVADDRTLAGMLVLAVAVGCVAGWQRRAGGRPAVSGEIRAAAGLFMATYGLVGLIVLVLWPGGATPLTWIGSGALVLVGVLLLFADRWGLVGGHSRA